MPEAARLDDITWHYLFNWKLLLSERAKNLMYSCASLLFFLFHSICFAIIKCVGRGKEGQRRRLFTYRFFFSSSTGFKQVSFWWWEEIEEVQHSCHAVQGAPLTYTDLVPLLYVHNNVSLFTPHVRIKLSFWSYSRVTVAQPPELKESDLVPLSIIISHLTKIRKMQFNFFSEKGQCKLY